MIVVFFWGFFLQGEGREVCTTDQPTVVRKMLEIFEI